MPNPTPDVIRRIFLNPRPHVALMTAADLFGMTLAELRRDIDDGVIVASSTPLGLRISREEMMATAMRLWEQTAIEDALGDEAAGVLPEAIRLVLLRARVPRYQRDVLAALAEQHGTSIDEELRHELEGMACTYAEELRDVVPSLRVALRWPGPRAISAS